MFRYKILILLLFAVIKVKCTKSNTTLNDISHALIKILTNEKAVHDIKRFKELKDKLENINNYVVDREKFSELLLNVTRENDLNNTGFYEALADKNDFEFLKAKDTKSLYLKLKERLNRDDILNILAERANENSTIWKSARRTLDKFRDNEVKIDEDEAINDVVDRILAEEPQDNHKFSENHTNSIYWGKS